MDIELLGWIGEDMSEEEIIAFIDDLEAEEDARKNKRELYDLSADPRETKNLISEHPDIERQLTARLTALINSGRSTPGKPQKNDTPLWRDLVWIQQ